MVLAAPGMLGNILPQSRLRFHPMLAKALQQRSRAADDFAAWAQALAREWASTRIVCAAHSAVRQLEPGGWHAELTHALSAIRNTLDHHRAQHG
ncbi:hypothetical protein [Novosphingobium resinovorum]|uniref:hypothetical protein n=1 Tax=Novosphingobium resinovorum TaxID=158500 RepID=UPI00359ADDC9